MPGWVVVVRCIFERKLSSIAAAVRIMLFFYRQFAEVNYGGSESSFLDVEISSIFDSLFCLWFFAFSFKPSRVITIKNL